MYIIIIIRVNNQAISDKYCVLLTNGLFVDILGLKDF